MLRLLSAGPRRCSFLFFVLRASTTTAPTCPLQLYRRGTSSVSHSLQGWHTCASPRFYAKVEPRKLQNYQLPRDQAVLARSLYLSPVACRRVFAVSPGKLMWSHPTAADHSDSEPCLYDHVI